MGGARNSPWCLLFCAEAEEASRGRTPVCCGYSCKKAWLLGKCFLIRGSHSPLLWVLFVSFLLVERGELIDQVS